MRSRTIGWCWSLPAGVAPASVAQLRDARFVRIALGNPASVPAGRYARDALQRAGLWNDLAPRLVFGENVRQVLDYVARGEADAGFVYASDVLAANGRVQVAETVATSPIVYPVAVVKGSANVDAARAFVAFLDTPAARAILLRHGFAAPEP